jgi:hypothetical protein
MHPKVASSEFRLGPKLALIIGYTNVTWLKTVAAAVWRLTIYKSCNLSCLNLVQFSKLGPKRSKLKKMHPKVPSSEFGLGPKLAPIISFTNVTQYSTNCSGS